MIRTQWPTPEQIGVYLTTHGWHFARPMKQPGAVYAYDELSDDGEPMELFVPEFAPGVDETIDFATSVLAVVETVKSFEKRSEDEVFADMLAIDPRPAPRAPAASAS
jgi:hypothetical protein